MGRWEKQWILIPNTTMKQFKWVPASQDSDKVVKSKSKTGEPKQRRLFTDPYGDINSRASLSVDEDSNMSTGSTASDSMDGLTQITTKREDVSQLGEVKQMTIMSEGGVRYTGETNAEGEREGRRRNNSVRPI